MKIWVWTAHEREGGPASVAQGWAHTREDCLVLASVALTEEGQEPLLWVDTEHGCFTDEDDSAHWLDVFELEV